LPFLATWLWLLLVLGPLLWLERWLTRHLHIILYRVFRHLDVAATVYALLHFPGVVVHEGSHWLAATLLGVRVTGFSLTPQLLPNGVLRFGYVETEAADFIRGAIIGLAPLIGGAAVILLIAYPVLNIAPVGLALGQGDVEWALRELYRVSQRSDFWLWAYLTFTVSNLMLPSASDRAAWPPLTALVIIISGIALYAGYGPVLYALLDPLTSAAHALASAFSITIFINACLVPMIAVIEWALSHSAP
jgi:hypothetical protein